jgi:hypothetical protein
LNDFTGWNKIIYFFDLDLEVFLLDERFLDFPPTNPHKFFHDFCGVPGAACSTGAATGGTATGASDGTDGAIGASADTGSDAPSPCPPRCLFAVFRCCFFGIILYANFFLHRHNIDTQKI